MAPDYSGGSMRMRLRGRLVMAGLGALVLGACGPSTPPSVPQVVGRRELQLSSGRVLVLSVREPVSESAVRRLVAANTGQYQEVHVLTCASPPRPPGSRARRWVWVEGDIGPEPR